MADLDPKLQRLIEAYPHLVVGYTKSGRPVFEIAGGDDITVDNGSLADFVIASDTIGGKEYQFIKVVDGTLDSTTKATVDANGLWVRATIAAGQKIQLTDGTSDATVRNLAANDALNVAIVDGAGNHITSIGGTGGTTSTDDADFTPFTTTGTPDMGVYESTPTSVTDGDMGIIGIDQNRRVRMSLEASTLDVAHDAVDSGNPVLTGSRGLNAMPAAVSASGDRTRGISDMYGRKLVGHIDGAMQVTKQTEYTSAQTGTTIWDPTAGKKIVVTSYQLGTDGTTAALVTLWFGDNADTTFTQGTDQVLFRGKLTPTSTATPGVISNLATPVYCNTADRELHITTSAAITLYVTVYGYEL